MSWMVILNIARRLMLLCQRDNIGSSIQLRKNDNPSRYLQTLHSISAEKNSTIIFPLPMELLGGFNEAQVLMRMIFMRTRGSEKFKCRKQPQFFISSTLLPTSQLLLAGPKEACQRQRFRRLSPPQHLESSSHLHCLFIINLFIFLILFPGRWGKGKIDEYSA